MRSSSILISPLSQVTIQHYLRILPSTNIFSFITSKTPIQSHYNSLFRSFTQHNYFIEQIFLLSTIIFFSIQLTITTLQYLNIANLIADIILLITLITIFILSFIPTIKHHPQSQSIFTWIIIFVFFTENIITICVHDNNGITISIHKIYFSITANHFIMALFIKINVTMNFNHFIIVGICDIAHVLCMILFMKNFHCELLFMCLIDFFIFANEIRNEIVNMKMFNLYIKEQKKRNENSNVIQAAKIGRCKCKMWLEKNVKENEECNGDGSIHSFSGNNSKSCFFNYDEIEISKLNAVMEKEMSFCIDNSGLRNYMKRNKKNITQMLNPKESIPNTNRFDNTNHKDNINHNAMHKQRMFSKSTSNLVESNGIQSFHILFQNNNNTMRNDVYSENSRDYFLQKNGKTLLNGMNNRKVQLNSLYTTVNLGKTLNKTRHSTNREKYRQSKTYNITEKRYLLSGEIYQKIKEPNIISNMNNYNSDYNKNQNDQNQFPSSPLQTDQPKNKIITKTLKEVILDEINKLNDEYNSFSLRNNNINNNISSTNMQSANEDEEEYRDLGLFSIRLNKSLFRIYLKIVKPFAPFTSSTLLSFDLLFLEIMQNRDEYKQKVESVYQNLIMSKISNEFREGITSLINIINTVKTQQIVHHTGHQTHLNNLNHNLTPNQQQQDFTPSSEHSNRGTPPMFNKPLTNNTHQFLPMPQHFNTKKYLACSSSVISPNCMFSINYSTLNKLAIISECVLIIVADLAEYVHIKSSSLILNKNEGNKSFLSFLDLKFFLEEAAHFYISLFRKSIKIEFDIDNNLYKIKILTNELKLKQIITNILSNAIKQTPNNKNVIFRINLNNSANNNGSDGIYNNSNSHINNDDINTGETLNINSSNQNNSKINDDGSNVNEDCSEDNDSLTYDQNRIQFYDFNTPNNKTNTFILENQNGTLITNNNNNNLIINKNITWNCPQISISSTPNNNITAPYNLNTATDNNNNTNKTNRKLFPLVQKTKQVSNSKLHQFVKIAFVIEDQGKGLSHHQMHKLNKNDFNPINSDRSDDIHITKSNNYSNKKGLNSGLKIIRKLANEINAKITCEHIYPEETSPTSSQRANKTVSKKNKPILGTRISISICTEYKNNNLSQGLISSAVSPTLPKTLSTQNTLYQGIVKLHPTMKKLVYEDEGLFNMNKVNNNTNNNASFFPQINSRSGAFPNIAVTSIYNFPLHTTNMKNLKREKTVQSEQQHLNQLEFKKCYTELSLINKNPEYLHNNTISNKNLTKIDNMIIHSDNTFINQNTYNKFPSQGSNSLQDQSGISKRSGCEFNNLNHPSKVTSKTFLLTEVIQQPLSTQIHNLKQFPRKFSSNCIHEKDSNNIFNTSNEGNESSVAHRRKKKLQTLKTMQYQNNITINHTNRQNVNKIMIVDDSINHQTNIEVLIKKFFKKKKVECTIVKFEDGAEVLNELYKEICSNDGNLVTKMIFCDEQMNFINGSQCFTVIKQSSVKGTCNLNVPFVLCSADASNLRNNCKSMGLEFIYDKPLSIGDIEYIFTSKVINGCNNEIEFS